MHKPYENLGADPSTRRYIAMREREIAPHNREPDLILDDPPDTEVIDDPDDPDALYTLEQRKSLHKRTARPYLS